MNVLNDAEITFTDTFAAKPIRTFVVNTNAPLHSANRNVSPSCGVATFSPQSQLNDRFILWRAIGQKLLLEERSLCRTIENGSMCLDFCRTLIVPGTSICLLDQGVLCIVVPTQSSVHRFYVRLIMDPLYLTMEQAPSIFEQINEREFLGEYHQSYMLSSSGYALKATVLQHVEVTKIAYCMAEGQLVVISMAPFKSDQSEEVTYRESNIISRMMGGVTSGALDVCALSHGVCSVSSSSTFYAVYGDGYVRAWNSEQPTNHLMNLGRIDAAMEFLPSEVNQMSCRSYLYDGMSIVVVAVSTSSGTDFYFLRDSNKKFRFIGGIVSYKNENLLDFGLTLHNGSSPRLWAVWNSVAVANDYSFEYTRIKLSSNSVEADAWRAVASRTRLECVSTEMNRDQLKAAVFNSEAHPFDVVHRAVQIACEGQGCEAADGDWRALANHIDNYQRTREFDAKYVDRRRSVRTSAKEAREEAERKFYYSLASACDQLEMAARGPIGLLLVDMKGAYVAGLVQQDRFTVVQEAEDDVLELFRDHKHNKLEEIMRAACEYARKKDSDSSDSDSDESKGSDNAWTGASLLQIVGADKTRAEWEPLIRAFIQMEARHTRQRQPAPLERASFAGSFSTGLVAAGLMHVTRKRLTFVQNLLLLVDMLKTECKTEISFLNEAHGELSAIRAGYHQLVSQLGLKLTRDGVSQSVGSWVFSAYSLGLPLVRSEGGVSNSHSNNDAMDGSSAHSGAQYNDYIAETVNAAVRCCWPSSKSLLLCRCLASQQQYPALQSLCTQCAHPPSALIPALHYYKAIAHSGLGQPNRAMKSFNDAVIGVESGNEALLRALRPSGEGDRDEEDDDCVAMTTAANRKPYTLGEYYTAVIRVLHDHGHSEEVVRTAKAAIEKLPKSEQSTGNIYVTLFNHLVNRGNWIEALATIKNNKDEVMQRTTLRELMSRLLRGRDWTTITQLNYGRLAEQVETILMNEARAQDVSVSPHLFEVVYAFHMYNMDYQKAALVMFELALQLREATQTADLLRRRRDALAAASNLLDLMPENERFLYFPQEELVDVTEEVAAPEPVALVPDDVMGDEPVVSAVPLRIQRSIRRRNIRIIEAKDLSTDWAIANARVSILAEAADRVPPVDPVAVVEALVEAKQYDTAFDICSQCDLSFYPVLYSVARDAVFVDVMQPLVPPDWINENRRRLQGRSIGDHWSVVRGLLSSARLESPSDSRPLRAVATAILSHGASIPCWLQAEYVDHDISDYVLCLLDYDVIAPAVTVLTEKIQQEMDKVKSAESTTLLPYGVIAEVLKLAATRGESKELTRLNDGLKMYLARINAFETAAQFVD